MTSASSMKQKKMCRFFIECDAFDKFKQEGIFNHETAQSWLKNVLSKGGTESPMTLYKRFRGTDPGIEAMMRRDGIAPS